MDWQEHRHAPAPGTVLCRAEQIPDGGCMERRFGPAEAGFSVLVCREGRSVSAYVNVCPHFSLPLNAQPGQFLLPARRRIMCAWHCSVFRLEDGLCLDGPAQGMALEPVPVHLQAGQVRLGAPGTAACDPSSEPRR